MLWGSCYNLGDCSGQHCCNLGGYNLALKWAFTLLYSWHNEVVWGVYGCLRVGIYIFISPAQRSWWGYIGFILSSWLHHLLWPLIVVICDIAWGSSILSIGLYLFCLYFKWVSWCRRTRQQPVGWPCLYFKWVSLCRRTRQQPVGWP